MTKKSVLLFIILFGAMLLFGYTENLKGVSYPLIKAEFDVSYEQQGIMVSILSISYVVFCLIGGILLGRFGVKKAFITGFIFMTAGLLGAWFMPGFLSIAGSLIIVFAGFGLFEVSTNALATQLFTKRAALLMSLMHFFYGVGSSLSPRAAGIIAAGQGWRMVYFLTIPLVLLFFIPSIFARFPKQQGEDPEQSANSSSDTAVEKNMDNSGGAAKRTSFFTALKTPMVWVFSVVLGLMVAVEMCSANWASLYFQDVYSLDPKTTGAAFVSNFYILFTASRLLSGFAIEKIGYIRSLFIASFAVVLVFILGFTLGEKGVNVLPALGFFTAIYWPTLLAAAMVYFGKDAPVMTSAIIVIGGALNSGIQFLIGRINQFAGPAWGYRSCLLYGLLVIISLIILTRRTKKPYLSAP